MIGFMQKRCNSSANALELHLFYIKPSKAWVIPTRWAWRAAVSSSYAPQTPGCPAACPKRYRWWWVSIDTLRPRQNGQHFPDDIFKCIFFNENIPISIEISLKFVPRGPINNIPALVQMMAWCWPGNKPLSEPMMVSLLKHICLTQPRWVKQKLTYNTLRPEQNDWYFADNWHFQMHFLEWKILNKISLKFIAECQTNKKSTLVQVTISRLFPTTVIIINTFLC